MAKVAPITSPREEEPPLLQLEPGVRSDKGPPSPPTLYMPFYTVAGSFRPSLPRIRSVLR